MNVIALPISSRQDRHTRWPRGEQRLLLHNVPWGDYIAIGTALRNRPALRLTYAHGNLEFMTTSAFHEWLKKRWGRVFETLAEEAGLRIAPYGNMTFQREDLERGLEPDECYWILHEPQMRNAATWDPERDPPPDLVLEVEVSRSALDRMDTYAALGVPEVWRFDGDTIHVHLLQADRSYLEANRSPLFPTIPLEEMVRFLQPNEAEDFLTVIRSFRDWVHQYLPKTNP